ncbi:cold shock domain-containing protein [Lysobacter firmicutimachus]|uniref:Cold shock domain-containing protein n=1 Tax=Lysobacter firmicutimachus TaxID=1792846 RepID=A0AAU8MSY0_9GAMM
MDTGKRVSGTLVRWNDDRGYGFLAPDGGGPQVFMHVSALAPGSPRPLLNERFTFESVRDTQGKHSATRVRRPNERPHARSDRHRRSSERRGRRSWGPALFGLVAIGGIVGYAQGLIDIAPRTDAIVGAMPAWIPISRPAPARYRCDGRTHCSQMTSCAEARYFLAHCPNVKMDGNGDGDPCEQQWCN